MTTLPALVEAWIYWLFPSQMPVCPMGRNPAP